MISSFSGRYHFLSNFCPALIDYERRMYPSLEHAYQAAKTLNEVERVVILRAPTPGQAKRLGQRVTKRPDWEELKVPIMRTLIGLKFAPGTRNADLLLLTGDEQLVEGNSWGDKFWGICGGVGQNHLGRLLMEQRESLK